MWLFPKKERFENTMNYYYINMAEDILSSLGHEEITYCASYAMGGAHLKDIVYESYGLKIVRPEVWGNNLEDPDYKKHHCIYIEYYGKRVLDKQDYIQGPWEAVLVELHNKIPVILRKEEEQKQREKKYRELISLIDEISHTSGRQTVQIDNEITIESYDDEDDYYRVNNFYYSVTHNSEDVFRAARASVSGEISCSTYTPGTWEEKMYSYLKQLKITKQREEESMLKKRASESLIELKKLI